MSTSRENDGRAHLSSPNLGSGGVSNVHISLLSEPKEQSHLNMIHTKKADRSETPFTVFVTLLFYNICTCGTLTPLISRLRPTYTKSRMGKQIVRKGGKYLRGLFPH